MGNLGLSFCLTPRATLVRRKAPFIFDQEAHPKSLHPSRYSVIINHKSDTSFFLLPHRTVVITLAAS